MHIAYIYTNGIWNTTFFLLTSKCPVKICAMHIVVVKFANSLVHSAKSYGPAFRSPEVRSNPMTRQTSTEMPCQTDPSSLGQLGLHCTDAWGPLGVLWPFQLWLSVASCWLSYASPKDPVDGVYFILLLSLRDRILSNITLAPVASPIFKVDGIFVSASSSESLPLASRKALYSWITLWHSVFFARRHPNQKSWHDGVALVFHLS